MGWAWSLYITLTVSLIGSVLVGVVISLHRLSVIVERDSSFAVTPALVLALCTIVHEWDADEPMESDVVSESVEIIRAALGLGGEE